MSSSAAHGNPDRAAPTPAGGMASPLTDPPSASPTPLRGQQETNQDSDAAASSSRQRDAPGESKESDLYSAAFDFGWQSRLQYGSAPAKNKVTFENMEAELEKQWSQKHKASEKRMPWQEARKIAKDAWNQVYDALTDSERTEK